MFASLRYLGWLLVITISASWSDIAVPQPRDRPQATAKAEYLRSVVFVNGIGWTVGDAGSIFTTRDGGVNWQAQRSPVDVSLHGVYFTNSQSGLAVGNGGIVVLTSDGGNSWREVSSGTKADLMAVQS